MSCRFVVSISTGSSAYGKPCVLHVDCDVTDASLRCMLLKSMLLELRRCRALPLPPARLAAPLVVCVAEVEPWEVGEAETEAGTSMLGACDCAFLFLLSLLLLLLLLLLPPTTLPPVLGTFSSPAATTAGVEEKSCGGRGCAWGIHMDDAKLFSRPWRCCLHGCCGCSCFRAVCVVGG